MRRIVLIFVFLAVLTVFAFFNIGKWLDATEKPVKSDIIVCLGGGTVERVKKSIYLVEQGYADKKVFLLLGESWYNQPYIKKNHPDLSVMIEESPKNTKEEVLFIKNYMKEHGYKSALIVTDPPHSRRVSLLSSLVSVQGDEALRFHIVGSDLQWWDQKKYYQNEQAMVFVKNETLGIIYSLVAYGLLEKLGFVDEIEAWREGRKN